MAAGQDHRSSSATAAELTEADKAAVFGAADLQSVTYFAGRFGLPPERIADLRGEYLGIIGKLIDGAWT